MVGTLTCAHNLEGMKPNYVLWGRRPSQVPGGERCRLPVWGERAGPGWSLLTACLPRAWGRHSMGLCLRRSSALTVKFSLQRMPCTPTAPSSWRAAPREARRWWMPPPRPLRPRGPSARGGG